MHLKNTKTRFGIVSITFHWILALLVIGMLGFGLYMVNLPTGPQKIQFIGLHKATGILVLTLVILRLIWRFNNIVPELKIPLWELISARIMHWLLYFFMIAMPLSGWIMSSAAGRNPSFYGLFTLPSIVAPNPELMNLFDKVHEYFAYALIAAIVVHTLAALKHHFIDKDDVMTRILHD